MLDHTIISILKSALVKMFKTEAIAHFLLCIVSIIPKWKRNKGVQSQLKLLKNILSKARNPI